jgi:ribonuclease E
MATKRMLVDAIHPEETRIVVTNGNRLEEFDFESAQRRQLRGNIYLAKVTRVEPSLQAAFIEYGGNRHGFLAFSEIHPDYYQIPVADREALLREEEAEEEAAHAEADAAAVSDGNGESHSEQADSDSEDSGEDNGHIEQAPANAEPVESIGGGDALEEMPERRRASPSRRSYKIQEVIKRRQVMLVQVVKEERGNKGAALTTYLSLAGRYSVLMPNTARGGGISRKITNAADRKRLKEIVGDLEVPQGQGIILRTAGATRTKAEVKRDFEYLQRLWENVRTLTLQSTAPCLVYEEGSLIKRTIRDLYSKEIDELLVAGDDAYREAKDFMRMIMPSHAKNVQLYKEEQPIFSRYNVESQLDQMFSPQVTLPSGGYIVINPTEALVSIDVNSGRATKEHNIEDTALQTNLEAAEEISRQLRLRDLAGLIVIDFIDMMENRSNRAVERKLKDCLKNDRARIQVGRISHFGLMEMSRQRIRHGVVESSTHICEHCAGTGRVRSVESVALLVMRAVEDHVLRKPGQSINVKVPTEVALYLLNSKRGQLTALELRHQLSITILADDTLVAGSHFAIERGEARALPVVEAGLAPVRVDTAAFIDADMAIEDEDEEEEAEAEAAGGEDADEQQARGGESSERNGRRRRRRRRGGERADDAMQPVQRAGAAADEEAAEEAEDGDAEPVSADGAPREDDGEPRRRRRRGRRGGRRNRRFEDGEAGEPNGEAPVDVAAAVEAAQSEPETATLSSGDAAVTEAGTTAETAAEDEAPAPKPRRSRRKAEPAAEAEAAPEATAEAAAEAPAETAKPKRSRRKPAKAAEGEVVDAAPAEEASAPAAEDAPTRPKRTRRPKAGSEAAPAEAASAETAPVETVASAPVVSEADVTPEPAPDAEPAPVAATAASEPAAEGTRSRRVKKELPPEGIVVSSASPAAAAEEDDQKPKKVGWWQRRFGLG